MRQEVYRVAYDEASAELSEILGKFEQLRLRKDRMEKVVEALKPLVALEAPSYSGERSSHAAEVVTQASPEPVQPTPSPIPYPVQPPATQGNDPFGRREPSSSSAAKDVSEYSRLFNTGVSRGN
jgi:hypothetical protein